MRISTEPHAMQRPGRARAHIVLLNQMPTRSLSLASLRAAPRRAHACLRLVIPSLCRRVNFNPGVSLFVKDSVQLPDAAVLPCADLDAQSCDDASSTADAADAGGGLGAGAIAGVAVGAATAAVAVSVACWRHRRQRRSTLPTLALAVLQQQQQIPRQTSSSLAAAGHGSVLAASSASPHVSTPRRRPGGSP